MAENIKNNVYTDSAMIKNKMIEILKDYEDLNNLDMSKLAFHSYIIEALSFLTADTMFYSSMNYKNNFMIVATLQEAIYNWASYQSYQINTASPSYVNALVYFPKDFEAQNVTFTIPQYSKFFADDIVFMNDFEIVVNYNGGVFNIQGYGENFSFFIPFQIDGDIVKFNLLLKQFDIQEEEIFVNTLVQPFQYYNTRLSHDDSIYKLDVVNREVDFQGISHLYSYQRATNIFSMGPQDRKYVLKLINDNEFELLFGNGQFGKQLLPNSILSINKYTTKGSNGRIIKGSLNTMDRIYTTVQGQAQIVDINVTNVTDGYGGTDVENKYTIKENSIRQFRSKKALTSEKDYEDFVKIIGPSTVYNTKPILKRSDLKINEVTLFHTLTLSEETDGEIVENIIPTNTIGYTFPNATQYIEAYETYVHEGIEYYCPFAMSFNDENKLVSYIYFIDSVTLLPLIDNLNMTQYPVSFNYVHVYTNNAKTLITFDIKYTPINTNFDDSNLTGHLNLKYPNITYRAGTFSVDTNNDILSVTMNTQLLRNGPVELVTELYYSGTKFADGGPSVLLKEQLDTKVVSSFIYVSTDKYVYDIPVIKKSFIDDIVSPDDRENFEFSVLQNYLSLDLVGDRALNVFVNNKFTKTIGNITNYFYNDHTYEIINFTTTFPTSPSDGDTYIVDPNTIDSILVLHKNEVMKLTLGAWEYIEADPNDIALNNADDLKYTFTGVRWFYMNYPVNLPLDVTIFVDPSYAIDEQTIKDTLKEAIVSGIENRFGPDRPIYRAEITAIIQDYNSTLGVVFSEINEIEIDVLFNYNISRDLTKQQLLEYTPEYIHVKKENINIKVKKINKPERF